MSAKIISINCLKGCLGKTATAAGLFYVGKGVFLSNMELLTYFIKSTSPSASL